MSALDRPCPICGAPAEGRCRQPRADLGGEPQTSADYDPAVTMAGVHLGRACADFVPGSVIMGHLGPAILFEGPAELVAWVVTPGTRPLDTWS